MLLHGEIILKTKIEINNKEHILEIHDIKDGKITGIKLDNELFIKQIEPNSYLYGPNSIFKRNPFKTITITPDLIPTKKYKTTDKKKCSKCKKWYPVTEFHKNKATKDGLQSYCKNCKKYSKKKYRQKNLKKDILVFETWIKQLNIKKFTTEQFLKQHPNIKRKVFDKILIDQIQKKHISQMGKNQFKVNIND